MYYGMKRCLFCEDRRGCSILPGLDDHCEQFVSGGVLPEIAVDLEVAHAR